MTATPRPRAADPPPPRPRHDPASPRILHHLNSTTIEGNGTMSTTAPEKRPAPWRKIIATGAILTVGALATAGAFAVFTDSDTASLAVDAGELDIVATGDYTVADIAPGDTVERPILLELPAETNDGDLVAAVTFGIDVTDDVVGTGDAGVAGSGSSLIAGADGLTYELVTCDGGTWTTAGAVGAPDRGPYDCDGTEVISSSGKLSALEGATGVVTLTPADFGVDPTADGTFPSDAGDVELSTLMRLVLPTAADNDYENASASITYTASAIQRDGVQR
jgi:hypothetical protein